MLTAISPNIPPEYMEYVQLNPGKIDKSKTYVDLVKNYDKNTTVDVVYGFLIQDQKIILLMQLQIRDLHLEK